jgi:hypothetical protein
MTLFFIVYSIIFVFSSLINCYHNPSHIFFLFPLLFLTSFITIKDLEDYSHRFFISLFMLFNQNLAIETHTHTYKIQPCSLLDQNPLGVTVITHFGDTSMPLQKYQLKHSTNEN